MKKIFTLIMVAIATISLFAITPTEQNQKMDPTGHATELSNKKLQYHKQVAKHLGMDKLERKAMPTVTAEAKQLPTAMAKASKAQSEVINLNYDAFAAMMYYEVEGEWWIGLSCDDWSRPEYGHNLNLEWKAPMDNPCGTFTTEDFVYDYTHLTTPFSYGSIHFSEITMTLSHEQVNANLERYTLTATLVGEDGITYEVNAVHENIVPKAEVASVILDATITPGDVDFTLQGKNEELDITLVFRNPDIIGSYGMYMVSWDNSQIIYNGVTVDPREYFAL